MEFPPEPAPAAPGRTRHLPVRSDVGRSAAAARVRHLPPPPAPPRRQGVMAPRVSGWRRRDPPGGRPGPITATTASPSSARRG